MLKTKHLHEEINWEKLPDPDLRRIAGTLIGHFAGLHEQMFV